MTFTQEFLKELQERVAKSDKYLMTKYSVVGLLKLKQLIESDKKVIYDAIRNDFHRTKDPLSLRKIWKERIKDSKLRFEY